MSRKLAWILVLLLPLMLQAAEKPNLKDGAWRVAIQMVIPNATGPSTGPMQFDRCLSASNITNLLISPANTPCTLTQSELKRDKLTWQMHCTQNGYKATANGTMLFKGTTFDAEVLTVSEGPQNIKITTKLEGRYIGECVATNKAPPASKGGGLKPYSE